MRRQKKVYFFWGGGGWLVADCGSIKQLPLPWNNLLSLELVCLSSACRTCIYTCIPWRGINAISRAVGWHLCKAMKGKTKWQKQSWRELWELLVYAQFCQLNNAEDIHVQGSQQNVLAKSDDDLVKYHSTVNKGHVISYNFISLVLVYKPDTALFLMSHPFQSWTVWIILCS